MKPRWTKPGNYQRGVPNKTEQRYAQYLEVLKRAGEILDYRFEPIKFKLADKTFYSPDFLVIYPDHVLLVEIKGFLRDDANVKFKVAAKLFPWFRFCMVREVKKQWHFEYADGGE